ncbi:histidine kinase dimerization/phosphoacceptor domain-containing protein [Actinomadura madurae]|uniref:histidine kinase dimerization/phosphoacceptor domain-containing protein n=1 Tax=Actinomadura madurae TaxID=1993 RepID=UPI0020D258CD|nr:histidine kinase dimerization/phosphoacceptor domain-containing protein [Actinomadura madurae]MCP9964126.1 histidine kinase dimerization/phosphoacceptor domain-containing protein [Actinomadura madurae]
MGLLPAPARRFVRARVLDVAVLLAVAGITWAPPFPDGPAEWGPLAGTAAMLAAGTVIIAGRRIGVEPAAAAAAAAGVAGWALAASGRFATADELTNLLMSLAPVLLTYGGHLYARDRRRAWTAVALLTVAAAHPWSTSMQAAADGLLYICAPMLFGFYRETQRMLVRTLTDRARDAERERDLCADQARAQERTRMAVELHDVVTHRVSLMVLHAGALRITTADAAVRDAAEHVRAIGCEALAELRELIGVLRGSRRPLPRRWPDRRMIRSWRHRAFGGAADRPVRSVLRGGRGSVDAAAQHPRGHRAAGRQRRAGPCPGLRSGSSCLSPPRSSCAAAIPMRPPSRPWPERSSSSVSP